MNPKGEIMLFISEEKKGGNAIGVRMDFGQPLPPKVSKILKN